MDFAKEKERLEAQRERLIAQLNHVIGQLFLLDRLIAEGTVTNGADPVAPVGANGAAEAVT